MYFNKLFTCTKFHHDSSMHSQGMVENVKCAKDEEEQKNQEIILKLCLLISQDWLVQCASNWYVDLPSLGASLQQIWVNSGERSQSYIV